MSILNRIKELLKEYDYTLASLEREANLGQGTIRRWDTNIPSADKLYSVANLLNTSVDYLLTGKEYQLIKELSKDEYDLLTEYKKLDFRGRSAVMQAVLAEQDRMENEKNTSGNAKIG